MKKNFLPSAVQRLIESFESLPGIGPKTAARLTFYLLHLPQALLEEFGERVKNLKKLTVECSICFNVGEKDPCSICSENSRDSSLVCVVETPLEILNFEKTGKYQGVYHVLHGVIDPLENIGPEELRIAQLLQRLKSGKVKEIILATDPDMEGEATAMYLRREIISLQAENLIPKNLVISRLANGLPVGADLEFADELTLTRALEGRRIYLP